MKRILKSRVIWLALIQAVASVAIVVFTELDMAGVALTLKSVLDIYLRLDTTKPIGL